MPRAHKITHFCLEERKNRATGFLAALYDTAHPDNDLDPDGGRFVTLCCEHSTVCNHETLSTARYHLAAPWSWCEDCQALLDAAWEKERSNKCTR